MNRLVSVLALLAAVFYFWPLPKNLKWRKATILTVNGSVLFRDYTIIDSYDPQCRVAVRALRNPFNLLSTTEGAEMPKRGPKCTLRMPTGTSNKDWFFRTALCHTR